MLCFSVLFCDSSVRFWLRIPFLYIPRLVFLLKFFWLFVSKGFEGSKRKQSVSCLTDGRDDDELFFDWIVCSWSLVSLFVDVGRLTVVWLPFVVWLNSVSLYVKPGDESNGATNWFRTTKTSRFDVTAESHQLCLNAQQMIKRSKRTENTFDLSSSRRPECKVWNVFPWRTSIQVNA